MSKIVLTVLACLLFASMCLCSQPSKVLEKNFAFPPPVQWKSGNWEVSVIGIAWGPANSPAMASKGRKDALSKEAPRFFPDRSYALAIHLRAFAPSTNLNTMYGGSGLVLVRDVRGDFQVPLALTPRGFTRFSGSPGTMDLSFIRSNKTEVWDFFPVSPHQKELLFQSFAFTSTHRGMPKASFKVVLRHGKLALANVTPGARTECSDLRKSFSGTIGPGILVRLSLTFQGTKISGTEQYKRIGKTLYINGRVDSFGNFALQERVPRNHLTGLFNGKFSRGCRTMSGYFSKPGGARLLPFEFQQASTTTK